MPCSKLRVDAATPSNVQLSVRNSLTFSMDFRQEHSSLHCRSLLSNTSFQQERRVGAHSLLTASPLSIAVVVHSKSVLQEEHEEAGFERTRDEAVKDGRVEPPHDGRQRLGLQQRYVA